jgi:hypothetical protein
VAGLNLMGREVVRPGGAFDLDPLVVTIDVRELGITGYQAGDRLRAERHVDVGFADACRINARIIHGDDHETGRMLVDALGSGWHRVHGRCGWSPSEPTLVVGATLGGTTEETDRGALRR